MEPTPLHPILKELLVGVYDKDSDLYVLRGIPHLVRHIWRLVVNYWKSCIKIGQCISYEQHEERPKNVSDCFGYFIDDDQVRFPEPTDININMMPFIGGRNFESSCLPDNLKEYWDKIIYPILSRQWETLNHRFLYLTIQESFVEENTSQRRPGIHTETPGVIKLHRDGNEHGKLGDVTDIKKGGGAADCVYYYIHWGGGYFRHDKPHGGIYMASSVDDSCKIWNCRIMRDESGSEIIGEHGDISQLRTFLPEGEVLKKNTMYWFTDRTPHESLPLKEGTYRQFFRLVTDDVTVWFKDHSTLNPTGLAVNPSITKIVSGSKFDTDKKLIIVE